MLSAQGTVAAAGTTAVCPVKLERLRPVLVRMGALILGSEWKTLEPVHMCHQIREVGLDVAGRAHREAEHLSDPR